MKTIAIIPSGGKGLRMGLDLPKQYLKINDKEIIAYTIDTFQQCDSVDEIAVAAEEKYFALLKNIKEKFHLSKLKYFIPSGTERQDSVYNCLKNIEADAKDIIVVHDAARALLSSKLLAKSIEFAKENGGTVVALKAADTILKADKLVKEYINRDEIYYAQTPQIFEYGILRKAMDSAYEEGFVGSDESMLVKRAGFEVNIFPGDPLNMKLTRKEDLKLFEFLLKFRS